MCTPTGVHLLPACLPACTHAVKRHSRADPVLCCAASAHAHAHAAGPALWLLMSASVGAGSSMHACTFGKPAVPRCLHGPRSGTWKGSAAEVWGCSVTVQVGHPGAVCTLCMHGRCALSICNTAQRWQANCTAGGRAVVQDSAHTILASVRHALTHRWCQEGRLTLD